MAHLFSSLFQTYTPKLMGLKIEYWETTKNNRQGFKKLGSRTLRPFLMHIFIPFWKHFYGTISTILATHLWTNGHFLVAFIFI